jgi:hypothetical protein
MRSTTRNLGDEATGSEARTHIRSFVLSSAGFSTFAREKLACSRTSQTLTLLKPFRTSQDVFELQTEHRIGRAPLLGTDAADQPLASGWRVIYDRGNNPEGKEQARLCIHVP